MSEDERGKGRMSLALSFEFGERYRDRLIDTQLAFWTALLTVEGFFVTTASIAAVLSVSMYARLAVVGVVLGAVVAGVSLVGNFLLTRNAFQQIIWAIRDNSPDSLGGLEEADKGGRKIKRNENVAVGALLFQTIVIVLMFLNVVAPYRDVSLVRVVPKTATPAARRPELRKLNPVVPLTSVPIQKTP